jgi:hypothetical protein
MLPSHLAYAPFEREWLTSDGCDLIVKKGYAWDGCSPKIRINGRIYGTWDGPVMAGFNVPVGYYASLYHDALYQYKIGPREQADEIFLLLLRDFIFAKSYYRAVRKHGQKYWDANIIKGEQNAN